MVMAGALIWMHGMRFQLFPAVFRVTKRAKKSMRQSRDIFAKNWPELEESPQIYA
jgi:hypothetical protein